MSSAPDFPAIIENIEAKLDRVSAVVGTFAEDPNGWGRRRNQALKGLAEDLTMVFGAQFWDRGDVTLVRIGAVGASSTGGIDGALRNWLNAARKRVQA